MEDKVKGPKMAGIPSRMQNCGTIVSAPAYGNNMSMDEKGYMEKNMADYKHDSAKLKSHMSKDSQV